MAFVPGFEHDVFVSYAHGDDRAWINLFVDRLRSALSRLLPGAAVWIDKDDLRKSRDFEKDIPASLESSAALISLVSPTYVTRPYCVHGECRRFAQLVVARKQMGQRFEGPEFTADLFGFRCPILPMPNSAYWNNLIPGATDVSFCDDLETFPIASAAFEQAYRNLLRELRDLLVRMRNHCTPVLVHPHNPELELSETYSALTRELNAQSYRIVPEDELDPVPHVNSSDLAVILLGARFDETVPRLVRSLRDKDKPFVIWPSPALEKTGDLTQRGFFQDLVAMKYARRNLLSATIDPQKLKQEVLALLNPQAKIPPSGERGKPRIYLIYDSDRKSEIDHAGKIAYHYRDDFHFEHSGNPRRHSSWLTQSEGVLLVWGDAAEDWCATEFEQMVRLSHIPRSRGLCLFDPKDSKTLLADRIRSNFPDPPIHIAEQFGGFDPTRLEPFFTPLRRAPSLGTREDAV
jgi:hypothetical protein